MSNNNQIPWKIIIPAIVIILAAIIGATWTFWLNPPPSDFSISVKPMKGEVHQGGVITTAITIKGIHGYEYPVSLSASGLPSGIVVTLVPPIGGPTPSYTSTVTINVDPIVPAGIYEIVKKGTGADGKEHSCNYILTVKPSVTPTSPVTPSPSPTQYLQAIKTHPPTAPYIIDTMDSTFGWGTYKDYEGSSINIKSIPGKTDNAIEISYDLKEWGWVALNKRIDSTILSEIEGIRFFYKGTGKPNTIEFKLMYSDGDEYNGIDTTFGFLINAATVKDDWTQVEVPYDMLECWWSDKSCDDNPRLDLNKVRKIEFAISNKPEDGDLYGSGKVIIGDVQGITSSIPAPTPTPTPTPHIVITAPTNGEDVSREYLAKGTHSGLIENPNLNLYVLLLPHSTDKWWVQNLPSISSDGSWETTIYFGTETLGIGGDYTVSAIITTKDLEVAETLLSLPSYVAEYHVTVTRPI